jgi:hypothetical protein
MANLRDYNMLTPGNKTSGSPCASLEHGGPSERKHYEQQIPYIRLPFGKYKDAKSLIDAFGHTSNSSKRAMILGEMSSAMRKDKDTILALAKYAPEAILHADKSILTKDFVMSVLEASPYTYDFIPKEMQCDRDVIDAYRNGMMNNGCQELVMISCGKLEGQLQPSIGWGYESHDTMRVFKYDVSPSCDLREFYSVNNYQNAYEHLVQNRPYEYVAIPGTQGDDRRRYLPEAAFVHMARIAFHDDPLMLARYAMAEAQVIERNIEHCAKEASSRAPHHIDEKYAEAIAMAAHTIEHPPAILGITPKSGQSLVDAVIKEEKEAMFRFGEHIREKIAQCKENPSISRAGVDIEVLLAEKNPDTGLIHNETSEWWTMRGEDLARFHELQADGKISYTPDEIRRLESLSSIKPELRVGEQLVMDGFEEPTIGNR